MTIEFNRDSGEYTLPKGFTTKSQTGVAQK